MVLRDKERLHNDQGINPRAKHKIITTYAPNIGTPQYIRQMLAATKGETASNTILVEDS